MKQIHKWVSWALGNKGCAGSFFSITTKKKLEKKKQVNPPKKQRRLFLSVQAHLVSAPGLHLAWCEHFLCQDLEISSTHCHNNWDNMSVSKLYNTKIHFRWVLHLFTWITDIAPFSSAAKGNRTKSYIPQAFPWHIDQGITSKKAPKKTWSMWFLSTNSPNLEPFCELTSNCTQNSMLAQKRQWNKNILKQLYIKKKFKNWSTVIVFIPLFVSALTFMNTFISI